MTILTTETVRSLRIYEIGRELLNKQRSSVISVSSVVIKFSIFQPQRSQSDFVNECDEIPLEFALTRTIPPQFSHGFLCDLTASVVNNI